MAAFALSGDKRFSLRQNTEGRPESVFNEFQPATKNPQNIVTSISNKSHYYELLTEISRFVILYDELEPECS
jgi:hypothetical protein